MGRVFKVTRGKLFFFFSFCLFYEFDGCQLILLDFLLGGDVHGPPSALLAGEGSSGDAWQYAQQREREKGRERERLTLNEGWWRGGGVQAENACKKTTANYSKVVIIGQQRGREEGLVVVGGESPEEHNAPGSPLRGPLDRADGACREGGGGGGGEGEEVGREAGGGSERVHFRGSGPSSTAAGTLLIRSQKTPNWHI